MIIFNYNNQDKQLLLEFHKYFLEELFLHLMFLISTKKNKQKLIKRKKRSKKFPTDR